MAKLIKLNNKVLSIFNKLLKWTSPYPIADEVTIGTQVWKTKNLDIDDGGEGIYKVDNVIIDGINIGTQYYYTWDAANRVAESIEGWHLPTNNELTTLRNYLGESIAGKILKSIFGWTNDANGTNEYGFNGEPVGYYMPTSWSDSSGTYPPGVYGLGSSVNYWGSSSYQTFGYSLQLTSNTSNKDKLMISSMTKSCLYSARLIKDT